MLVLIAAALVGAAIVGATQQIVGEFASPIDWWRMRFRDDPPELLVMARRCCARTFA